MVARRTLNYSFADEDEAEYRQGFPGLFGLQCDQGRFGRVNVGGAALSLLSTCSFHAVILERSEGSTRNDSRAASRFK